MTSTAACESGAGPSIWRIFKHTCLQSLSILFHSSVSSAFERVVLVGLHWIAILSYWRGYFRPLTTRRLAACDSVKKALCCACDEKHAPAALLGRDVVTEEQECSPKKCGEKKKPVVAVCIPVYLRCTEDADQLRRLVRSIVLQNVTPDAIVIVDDGSPIAFPDSLDHVKHEFGASTCVIHVERLAANCGPAFARNVAVDISLRRFDPDFIAFTDSDCIADCSWIQNAVRRLQADSSTDLLSGRTYSFDCSLAFLGYYVGRYHDCMGTLNGRRIVREKAVNAEYELLFAPTCNLFVRAGVFEQVRFSDAFPTSAYEDVDFSLVCRSKGLSIGLDPNVIIFHDYCGRSEDSMEILTKFRNQFRKYGQSAPLCAQLHPEFQQWFAVSKSVPAL
eukprot:ANDGO_03528.mRNA.1 hypothetical protein